MSCRLCFELTYRTMNAIHYKLHVVGGKDDESAAEFFQRVMDTTGTAILWPSKLKFGAKSKGMTKT